MQSVPRGEKTESKAYNLIALTGVSAVFITGISSLLPKEPHTVFSLLFTLLFSSYLLIVISLTLTVLLASRAVTVRSYPSPDISRRFKMSSQSLMGAKIDRLATYMYCCAKNNQTNNIKVSYLMGAQLWFRNSVIMFLFLALILVPSFFGDVANKTVPSLTATPTLVSTLRQTQIAIPVTQISISSSLTVQVPINLKMTETPTLPYETLSPITEISTLVTPTP